MGKMASERPLLVQRNLILALLLTLAAASWAFLWWQARAMDMAAMMSATMGMAAPLFLAVWVVMMAAMMFPTAAPVILLFHRLQSARQQQGGAFVSTWIFVIGYMLVWAAAGILAYLAALGGEDMARLVGFSPVTVARLGALLLILAALYQMTPLKRLCLAKCRTPTGFFLGAWREGSLGALRMGLAHGTTCLGCCWLLFAILFPLGMMNIAAMALITLLIFAEKTQAWGMRAAGAAAVLLCLYGLAVLAIPPLLPTFMDMAPSP